MSSDEIYMQRCLELAVLGRGYVEPNPVVGAVLVHEEKIIGEGYHQQYGKAHAEVNCLDAVLPHDQHLISSSTLYVSLEPCAHFGKTPPCADLIIKNRIPKVVIGCRDPFKQVDGKGIEKLEKAGIQVQTGILESACQELNKTFFSFHTNHRPYVILKWAQTLDRKIAREDYSRVLISNAYTNRLVHHWRSEVMGIVVGTNTALYDDPELTNRYWPGKSPVRIVVDLNLRLPGTLKLFHSGQPTIVFNLHRHNLPFEKISVDDLQSIGVGYYQVTQDVSLVHQMMNALYRMNIQSVLIEGGAQLLQSFIDEGIWDEVKLITNEDLVPGSGISSPVLKDHHLENSEKIFSDLVQTYKNLNGSLQYH